MIFESDKTEDKKFLLIMGLGNLLMGDEGVGVHFVKKLSKNIVLPYTEILDGGTGGFHLMTYFENFEKIILIDATLDGQRAGTIHLIKPKYSKDFPRAMSTHDIGLKDLVDSLQLLGKLPKIFLFTVSIEKIQAINIGLSEKLEASLELLQEKVLDLVFALIKK